MRRKKERRENVGEGGNIIFFHNVSQFICFFSRKELRNCTEEDGSK